MKTRALLLLSATLLATGCTRFSSYLADKGSHCPGIDIDPLCTARATNST